MAENREVRHNQRLTVERQVLRESASEALVTLQASLDAEADPSVSDLDGQIQTVHHFLDLSKVLDTQLLDLLMDSDADMAPEIQQTAAFHRPFVGAIKSAEAKLSLMKRDSESEAQSVATQSFRSLHAPTSHAKLPKLELKHFSADPIEWQSFWDSFEAKVDSDPSISEVDKVLYLLKLLEGEAEEAIRGYRPTAKNYPVIVGVLKENFGNPETAKFKHFEALFELPSAEDEPSRLKEIYRECEKHIRCLVALGLKEETFGQVFVPLILSKLPRATRLQLHRSNGQQEWTLEALRDLMKSEILARDLSNRFSKGSGATKSKQPPADAGTSKGQGGSSYQSQKPKGGRPWSTQGSLVVNSNNKGSQCAYCGGDHYPGACTRYTTVEARKSVLRDRCFKCLSPGHTVAECKSTKSCYHCSAADHNSSLCYRQHKSQSGGSQKGSKSGDKSQNGKGAGGPETSLSVNSTLNSGTHTVLKMANVHFPAHQTSVRMYFDDGSTSSYIKTATAKRLKLPLSKYQYASVGRFGSNKRETKKFRTAELSIPLKDGSTFTATVHVIDVITTPVQKLALDPNRYPSLQIYSLADSLCQESEMVEIDALIGGDYLHRLFTGERIAVDDGLFLYGSKLGYIAAGTVEAEPSRQSHHTAVVLTALADPNQERSHLERFWALEDIGINDDPTILDDEIAQSKFDKSLRKVDGRYQVGLPWRGDSIDLPSNYGLAMGRLKSLQNRLKGDDSTVEQYDKIIVDQLRSGIIERVDDGVPVDRVHYIPHHCVVKQASATTKVRIVYDASAKSRKTDKSLNESLLRGPINLADLCGFLLRARIPNIVLLSDIEKAFHQISIQPEDRNCLRFLWLKRPWLPPTRDNLVTLRFCRVPFGMVCSPFLLDATIRHHLEEKASPAALDIKQNLYVDNILGGHQDVQNALKYYREAKQYFSEISMNLREWYSNSTEFLDQIAVADRGALDSPKILGIPWDTISDTLACIGPTTTSQCGTKRQFLSYLSSLFDPCGWISPVIVNAKIILQELWKVDIGWDKQVDDVVVGSFEQFQLDVQGVKNITLPRQVNLYVADPKATHELHCFVDASAKAYGAVIYIRSCESSGKCSTGLLFAKVRLAPIKSITIPRLELTAAVTGVRIIRFVITQLESKLNFARKVLWSDSKCVLFWLQSTKNLKVFVRNRLAEIKRKTTDFEFRYVPTAYNPADMPSRGTTVDELKSSNLWWQGPRFLGLPHEMWPENIPGGGEPREAAQEVVVSLPKQMVLIQGSKISSGLAELVDLSRYSSWKKLERVTAFLFLAVEKFKSRNKGKTGSDHSRPLLQPSHYRGARIALIRLAQDQIDPKSPAYKHFRLSEDTNGVLRCFTRMGNSSLCESAQAPILLPEDNPITSLIIQNGHEVMAHAGVRHTLVHLRSMFWVVQGKWQVQKTLHRCPACRKTGGGHYKAPEFAPLPSFRVNQTYAFDKVGIDYLGPLLVKIDTEGQYQKVWVALFTCCVTRAVHLDVVVELSAEQFLLCFRRFVALYSKPSLIVSDNATQFKAVNAAFVRAAHQWSDGEGIEWKFIVESAPWMGGFYERLVGSVKSALRKTLGTKRLNIYQLTTVLFEIAAIVNSRPLVPGGDVGLEPGQLALTPGHFLPRAGRSGFRSLEGYLDSWESVPKPMSQTLLESWQRGQHILNEYWISWHNDYLTSLREESKTGFRQRNYSHLVPEVGAVVQIKDGGPRCLWKLGVIQSVRQSSDGHCRAADVRLASARVITRPLKLIFPLEQTIVDAGIKTTSGNNGPQSVRGLPKGPTAGRQSAQSRPKRRAAVQARHRIRLDLLSDQSDDE